MSAVGDGSWVMAEFRSLALSGLVLGRPPFPSLQHPRLDVNALAVFDVGDHEWLLVIKSSQAATGHSVVVLLGCLCSKSLLCIEVVINRRPWNRQKTIVQYRSGNLLCERAFRETFPVL